ncbi:hypothetical protein EPUL_002886 [Erysiphe pulchra]|uniref:Uncharacterized protein n=1 Tax=Erysiphe pulchra TaxID=225359 RepID=A0A2S4PYC2_9PEZI|nr:hypothetical protein EPUL_002886 [Erysiphe pulchra]
MHKTIISSNVIFFENVPGRAVANYQLWIEPSKGEFQKREGSYNVLPVRNKRGRPSDEKGIGPAVTIDAGHKPLSNPLEQIPIADEDENVASIITKSNPNENTDNKFKRI